MDYRNARGEMLSEVAQYALEPLEDFFYNIIDAGFESGTVDLDRLRRIGPALVNHAQQEILGAIRLLEQRLGAVWIERALPHNKLGLVPGAMIKARITRRPVGRDTFEEVDIEAAFGPHDPRPVELVPLTNQDAQH